MPEPPRVLFAIGGLGRGGSERQLVQLIAATHPHRLRATVLTLSTVCDPDHAAQLRELGVELIQLAPARIPRAARPAVSVPRVFAAVRRTRPDAIYAWLEEASATVFPAAWALRAPLVIARRSVCGSGVEKLAVYRIPIHLAERQARIVTGNSEPVLAEAEARGVPPTRLRLVRNGHPRVEPLPEPDGAEVALGYVANYRAEKGHERLLEALSLLQAKTAWRLDMVGTGQMHAQVKRAIARRGLSQRVTAGTQITDIDAFWRTHHFAVLLSDDEGSPNALIEAAMRGRPAVGTDGGGTPEVVGEDGGLLVPHDPREIADALRRLIDDRELRVALGCGAHRRALEMYDLDKFVDGHLAAIVEATGCRVRGRSS